MWLSPRDLNAPGVRLFCLPHAGSGAAGFYRWKRMLPESIAVCPMLLPGREARLREPLQTDALTIDEELHRHATPHLERPYAIFGHSMGALLAFEWVRRIADAGRQMPVCLFVSGRKAPPLSAGHTELHRLEPELFVRELKARYGGEPDALLADPEVREIFLPILRGDLQVVETYRAAEGPRLPVSVRAMAGETDRSVSAEGLEGWSEVTSASFGSRRFPGDHFYHFGAGQTELLDFIAETLGTLSSVEQSSSPAAE